MGCTKKFSGMSRGHLVHDSIPAYSSDVRTRRMDKMATDHDPAAIKDRKAHRIEFLKKWKKPKPLELMIANSGKPSALQRGTIPALDALDVQTKWFSWNTITTSDASYQM